MAVKISKEESLKRISLRKEEVKKEVASRKELDGLQANVVLVLDESGSMHLAYDDGTVQEVIERLVPIAMQFDDNSIIDVLSFSGSFKKRKSISLKNYYGYIENEFGEFRGGGTRYSCAIDYIVEKYKNDNKPTYVIFITDGDNSDKDKTRKAIIDSANYPIFFQFVGVGKCEFSFLKELDNLTGRYVDNADFFVSEKFMDESDIYAKLLNEFPHWLSEEKVKDMINNKVHDNTNVAKKGLFSKLFR